MKKQEARNIAIEYLFDASYSVYGILGKVTIDDKGTQSEEGYSHEDLDKIKNELDWLITKLYKYRKQSNTTK